MNFNINDIPFKQFEQQLGMKKEQVLDLADDLKKLLSGNRTSLLSLDIKGLNLQQPLQAKLSLRRESDNSTTLLIHHARKNIQSDIKFSDSEFKKLEKGDLFNKQLLSKNGEKENYLVQLDKETNEVLKIREKDLKLPAFLTSEQKEQISKGKSIVVKGNNETKMMKIDLNETKGFSVYNAEGIDKNKKLSASTKNDLGTKSEKTEKTGVKR